MTVRMLLPYSMGKFGPMDPRTFEHDIDHPILEIYSSHSSIKQPIMEWLVETWGDKLGMGFDGTDYYIDFPSEADMNWFKLRWL